MQKCGNGEGAIMHGSVIVGNHSARQTLHSHYPETGNHFKLLISLSTTRPLNEICFVQYRNALLWIWIKYHMLCPHKHLELYELKSRGFILDAS